MTDRPSPPTGVPRWLWPPPGAEVVGHRIREVVEGDGSRSYSVVSGAPPDALHVRALRWLLDEYPKAPPPPAPAEHDVLLEVATTRMPGGRLGHAYAIDGRPLGDPPASAARGLLWRYVTDPAGERR